MVDAHLFTCLSCSIAFLSPEDQRVHYKSDHHRYNMKRRVASLPPISVEMFNQKVLERKQETSVISSLKGSHCEVCNKLYTTENSYRSHIQSKKHKENELRAATQSSNGSKSGDAASDQKAAPAPSSTANTTSTSCELPENTTEEEEIQTSFEETIAAARTRSSPSACLFCAQQSSSLEGNLTHMSSVHSFFIPDAEYLIDIAGLITYLGEKIAVGNVCIFCTDKGREFRSVEAVRKHMTDKSHCKIAYDRENDRLELSDYYDFTKSYPDADTQKIVKEKKDSSESAGDAAGDEGEWEDVDSLEDDEVDEVVEESTLDSKSSSDEEDGLAESQITYGDTPYELVLPSGARIGHRTMRRYYVQSFPGGPRGNKAEDPNSGAALVRRLLADKNAALVPRRGGFGAFGAGTDVVKARNRGEAKEAGRHVKEFRDQQRREDFKTKIAFIHNHQKHYRDPLLQ